MRDDPSTDSGGGALAGAAADARRRLAERGVGERVQRLVELPELARDEREALLLLGGAVQPLELRRDPVEPLEQRVQLAIGDVLRLHEGDCRAGDRVCRSRVRPYWEIARRGYGRYAAYPAATLAGIWTNTVFGFLQAYILLALYENRTEIGGYEPTDAVTYVWFAQAMLMTVYAFGWFEVALRIRSGDVATDLARPLDPLGYWLAFDLGRALYHLVFRGIPPFLLGHARVRDQASREPGDAGSGSR